MSIRVRSLARPGPGHGRDRLLSASRGALVVVLVLVAGACSDQTLGDLGGRSSDWIGEVATTIATTTTAAPVLTRSAATVEWVNDELGTPDPESSAERVLTAVFARAGDASRFLQASRAEIVAVIPDVDFPETLPAEVGYVTSQLVIESRTLRLASDPTVAFGLWSVEPYTRSRSVGQVAVLNVATDPNGSEVAIGSDTEATCAAFTEQDRLCSIEDFLDTPVWRLEGEGGVVHVWYVAPYRYELDGGHVEEDLLHTVIDSMVPLVDLAVAGSDQG
jgi:hypothetical protein